MNHPASTPSGPSTNRGLDLAKLHRLAATYGVGTSFTGWSGKPQEVAADTLVKVLDALGVSASTNDLLDSSLADAELSPWRRMLPPAVVIAEGKEALVPVHVPHGAAVKLWIVAEDSQEYPVQQRDPGMEPRDVDGVPTRRVLFALPRNLPLGWHTLHADSDGAVAQTALIVVPDRLATTGMLEQCRGWGLAAQLYSVRSQRSWGIGDFGDLADLAALSAERGADYVLVNPLHAAEPAPPLQPSPYSPSTRRFFNPLYLRIEAIEELAYLQPKERERVEKLAAKAQRLNHSADLLDRDRVYELKLEALELLHQAKRSPAREQAYQAFLRESGAGLEDFALWCALREDLAADDPVWHDPAAAPDTAFAQGKRRKLAKRIGFHSWLQWLCDEQLESAQRAAKLAGMRLGVVHDLAVGADLSSADAWMLRGVLAPGMSVGAPPDMYNQLGQDWSQPPWHPQRLAEAGYVPFRNMLRTVLRHAGGIRVDHILGLFRLWWVPEGNLPIDGAYVTYDHEALIGILALEAQRAGAVVIGEDLGTFEPWVRDYLADRGILGTSILWFENDGGAPLPPEKYRAQCLASVNTHDLPPTAGYLAGEHVALRDGLGLLQQSAAEELAAHEKSVQSVLDVARERGLLPEGTDATEEQQIEALHLLLAQTPAMLLGVSLVDTTGDRRVQNQPGTTGEQYPNWRLPLADPAGRPVLLEDLEGSARFNSLVAAVENALRANEAGSGPGAPASKG
ncbi:4-alpha-glucanotransferase [Arthrobacter crystallopoietes BAB-32]|uniref:4-alpha-glucanotransferase n=1 Tax=Arthrobacter crystallopoietes BAB-32 TaxID=1246476 RepID=N1UXC1_9MICC|nr:4-alpha-glucanotransferase [Arthrobacter crystallopoietes]EMY32404.1 4-alpha-glucanotransferase [Arthrobacter crystallopoietes BAB-32]